MRRAVPSLDRRLRDMGSGVYLLFDTSALLDLFGLWDDSHKTRRGDLRKEVSLLELLTPFLFSTTQIREEVRQHMIIGTELEKYIAFEDVPPGELQGVKGYVPNRAADFSLTALALRREAEGGRAYLITRDRSFVQDVRRAGSKARIVPSSGFAEALTVLTVPGSVRMAHAYRIQNNAFTNLSRSLLRVKREIGQAEYEDWQEFLNSRTSDKHEMIEALKETGVRLG
jgi:hypothetical protein